MKKILSFILSILILTSVFSGLNVAVYAEDTEDTAIDYASIYPYDSTSQYYYQVCNSDTPYDDSDDYIELVRYGGTSDTPTMPTMITTTEGVSYSVISVGPETYKNMTNITKVTIGAAIDMIDGEAFSGCTSMTKFAVNSSNPNDYYVTTSKGYALMKNSKTELVAYPQGRDTCSVYSKIKTIHPKAFYNNKTITSVTFSSSTVMRTIGDDAFNGCENLTEINIYTTTSIGARAFANCSSLTTVSRSSNIATLGAGAFDGCYALTSFAISSSDTITAIGDATFRNCESFTSFTIPSTITSLGTSAFEGCGGLTSMTVPSSVTTLGTDVFAGCSQLESISIPDQFTAINDGMFDGCEALKDYTISSKITSIGARAFAGCATFTKINIPNTVKTIGDSAFENCVSATTISIGTGITDIPMGAFAYCSGLKTISVPANIKTIGDSAFEYCEAATTITLREGLTSIGAGAFANCDLLKSLSIPASATTVGSGVAKLCSSLATLTVSSSNPNYVTENNVLFNKSKTEIMLYPATLTATSYTIPNTVVTIAESCFEGNTKLTTVTIDSSVKEIGANAFKTCESLATVNTSNSIERIGTEAFTDTLWYINKENALYTNGGLLYIDNILYTYVGETAPTSLSIVSGTRRIEENALSYLLNYDDNNAITSGLTSVTIPSSVKSIGSNAFSGCTLLSTITGAAGIEEIGSNAFTNCTALKSITLPATLKTIGSQAFYGCEGFTSLTIPAGVTSIGDRILQDCNNITSINVTSGNTAYCSVNGVLFDINKETLIQYPIANTATSYEIPNKVKALKPGAFSGIRYLTTVTVPGSLTEFGTVVYTDPDGTVISKPDAFLDEANVITMKGYEDTPAHTYAQENGLTFIALAVTGQMITENGNLKYYYSNDKYAYGWLTVSGSTYYFDANACAATGYYLVENSVYRFNGSGVMQETCGLLGDATADNDVTIRDVTQTQKYAAGIGTMSDNIKQITDVDGTGTVNVRDATYLQGYLAKSISKLPRIK